MAHSHNCLGPVEVLGLGLLAGVAGSYLRARFNYWRYTRRLEVVARSLEGKESQHGDDKTAT